MLCFWWSIRRYDSSNLAFLLNSKKKLSCSRTVGSPWRKAKGLTQQDLALKSGLGLRFIREIEQGKTSMRMDKVNQLLALFGMELTPAPKIKAHE
jgi:y4mF family transcriptional regulator